MRIVIDATDEHQANILKARLQYWLRKVDEEARPGVHIVPTDNPDLVMVVNVRNAGEYQIQFDTTKNAQSGEYNFWWWREMLPIKDKKGKIATKKNRPRYKEVWTADR